jgi:hypothetical protein
LWCPFGPSIVISSAFLDNCYFCVQSLHILVFALFVYSSSLYQSSYICPLYCLLTKRSLANRGWEGTATSPSNDIDVALLSLSLSSSAAITKLGATAVSCPPFTTLLPEEISRQMLKLPECMSIEEVYTFSFNVGFKRQFLDNFGARAADVKKWQADEKEGAFWINLMQQLLCAALVREGVHLKLQVKDGLEVKYLLSSYLCPIWFNL